MSDDVMTPCERFVQTVRSNAHFLRVLRGSRERMSEAEANAVAETLEQCAEIIEEFAAVLDGLKTK